LLILEIVSFMLREKKYPVSSTSDCAISRDQNRNAQ